MNEEKFWRKFAKKKARRHVARMGVSYEEAFEFVTRFEIPPRRLAAGQFGVAAALNAKISLIREPDGSISPVITFASEDLTPTQRATIDAMNGGSMTFH